MSHANVWSVPSAVSKALERVLLLVGGMRDRREPRGTYCLFNFASLWGVGGLVAGGSDTWSMRFRGQPWKIVSRQRCGKLAATLPLWWEGLFQKCLGVTSDELPRNATASLLVG